MIFVASTLLGIPMSVYKTFMLEERHKFNKTTPGDCSSVTFWRHGHSDLPLMDCSSLHSSMGSNVPVTALFHGSRYSCEVSLLSLSRWGIDKENQDSGHSMCPWWLSTWPWFNKLLLLPSRELCSQAEAPVWNRWLEAQFTQQHVLFWSSMGACISCSVDVASQRKTCARVQSKHIVIFDTLIKERKTCWSRSCAW